MAKRQKRSGSGFFMGLVIGIAVGATVVWVLTPQPRELEAMNMKATMKATRASTAGADTNPTDGALGADGLTGAQGATNGATPTILDLAMAAVERVRDRFDDALALGREAYEQGQAEVMQRFNQARSAE